MKHAAQLDAAVFVEEHLFSGVPFVFSETPSYYADVRSEVANLLDVSSDELLLIGSAKLGFSLNPDHLLRPFGPKSDLDFVVIAGEKFDAAALELVARASEFTLVGDDEKRRLKKSKENVFNGFLRPDQLPLTCTLSREWFPRLAGPFRHPLARRHPVKAWLFKSREHAAITYKNHQDRVQADITRILTQRGDL